MDGSENEVYNVLTQTFLVSNANLKLIVFWSSSFPCEKQEGLYQKKVNFWLAPHKGLPFRFIMKGYIASIWRKIIACSGHKCVQSSLITMCTFIWSHAFRMGQIQNLNTMSKVQSAEKKVYPFFADFVFTESLS